MGYIRINPKDAAKYGCPERIEFNVDEVGLRQQSAVEKACRRTLRWMWNQLSGVPELDESGAPIPVAVLDDNDNPVMEADGVTPKVTPRLRRDPEATLMLVYLALWGAGYRLDWDKFELRRAGIELGLDDDEGDVGAGKDDPSAPEMASTSIA